MSDFTPEQVDRAAEALWAIARVHGSSYSKSWEALHECAKSRYRREALAVLSAAGVAEELEHLRAGIKHVSGRMAEARATLQGYADRIDEHVFGELASELDDQWCDFETGMPLGAPEKVAPVRIDPSELAALIYSIEYGTDPDSAEPGDIEDRLGMADELIEWFSERHMPVVDEAALEKMLREVAALAAKRALEMYLRGESK